jgi:hypothetical protein
MKSLGTSQAAGTVRAGEAEVEGPNSLNGLPNGSASAVKHLRCDREKPWFAAVTSERGPIGSGTAKVFAVLQRRRAKRGGAKNPKVFGGPRG